MNTIYLAMAVYALTMSISPGPVNMVTLSSGVSYGFRGALPFVTGASTGFAALLLLVGLGVGQVAVAAPLFLQVLSVAGALFIVYVGYSIATAEAVINRSSETSSSFVRGWVMQWLNPKAWIAAVSGIAAFEVETVSLLLQFVTLYFVLCFCSIACWAWLGDKLSVLLTNERAVRIFNGVMGTMLILVALYLLILQFI